MFWRRGITLKTPTTARWSEEHVVKNNKIEERMIFSNFDDRDQGRSRQLVCVLEPNHPQYQDNAKLILNAPAMQRLLLKISCLSELQWMDDKQIYDIIKEAKRLIK